jgi:hypothetical protein
LKNLPFFRADVYLTPYLHKEQLTSSTLAFAVGPGRVVFSAPYWAAQELPAQRRGKLARFDNLEHMARSAVEILGNDSVFSGMKTQPYEHARSMT